MRKFKCTAVVTEWVKNDIIENWDAVDYIVAEDWVDAQTKFVDGIVEDHETDTVDVDIDDINVIDIGPADVALSVRLSSYCRDTSTMTVRDLVEYLSENFDMDSPIYLADYSGMVARYGGIAEDCLNFVEEG